MELISTYTITACFVVLIFIPYFVKFRKRQKLNIERRREAENLNIITPQAQFPMIDQAACIGCGSCVAACLEGDVLGVVYGKAMIINGIRCVGHGHCESACPVSAIRIGLGDITTRRDIPILDQHLQTNVPGLYIAGELGGISLIRNAITQGKSVVETIARNLSHNMNYRVKDILIVGAGPAGLSAALMAKKHNLSYLVVDQQKPGGTILQYPRRKLVMTQPVEIPLYGVLNKREYAKEDLLDIWQDILDKHQINFRSNERVKGVHKTNGLFRITGLSGDFYAQNVVLAMGRRGTPRKLNIPGEDMPKVMYQLIDAQSYKNNHVLVVGGGDSAVEAAIALSYQQSNTVTLSYRKEKLFRIKKKNDERIQRRIKQRKINPIFGSALVEIKEHSAIIERDQERIEIPNDYVFIFAGGIPPFKMLEEMGIQFGGKAKQFF